MEKLIKPILALSLGAILNTSYAKDTLVVWETDGHGNALEQAIEEFERNYDCKISIKEYNPVYQYEKYQNASEKPDVFILQSDKIEEASNQGIIESLDFMIEDKDLYVPVAINALTSKGKIWGAPRSIDTLVIFYNRDVMEYPFETFNEYVEYAKSLSKDKKYGLIGKLDNFYFAYGMISGMGGYTFAQNKDGTYDENDIGLNNQGAIKGINLIKDYANNYLPPSLLTDAGWEDMDKLFADGTAAAVINGPWNLSKYAELGINYGVVPLPILPNGNRFSPFFGVKGYVISSESKNKMLAQKFIRHINNPVYAIMRYMSTAELPPIKVVTTNPLIINDDLANAVSTQINYASMMPAIPRMGKVWDAMNGCLYFSITGKKSPQEAADDAVNYIKAD